MGGADAGRASVIAGHFRAADDPREALVWTVRAGEAVATLFGYAEAERHYRAATELARGLGDQPAEAGVLDALGWVLYRLARYDEVIDLPDRAAHIYLRHGHRDRYLTMVARSVEACHFAGRVGDGVDRAVPVLDALTDEDLRSSGAADLYSAVCGIPLAAWRFGEALEAGAKAVSLGHATGNVRAVCTSEISCGVALGVSGRLAEQLETFQRASQAGEALGDPLLFSSALASEGYTYLALGGLGQAEALLRRALEVAEGAGLIGATSFMRTRLANLLIARGRWADARRQAERAAAESQSLGPGIGHTYPLASLGRILLLLQGDRDDGLRLYASR
jgi:tetratricopeptide (TPR) repeat protein